MAAVRQRLDLTAKPPRIPSPQEARAASPLALQRAEKALGNAKGADVKGADVKGQNIFPCEEWRHERINFTFRRVIPPSDGAREK